MRILITGSKGYLAQNLIPVLEKAGHTISEYDLVDGYDLANIHDVAKVVRTVDTVIHLGAIASIAHCEKHPNDAIKVNIQGTYNVTYMAFLNGVKTVFVSTLAARQPKNVYGLSKALGERIVLQREGVVLRLANVYGGVGYLDHKTSVISNFIAMEKANEKATIFGDGSAKRDFIHIEDVCSAILCSLDAESGIYEISTGRRTNILRLANLIGVEYSFEEPRKGETNKHQPKQLEGWKPRRRLGYGLKRLKEKGR